MIPFYLEQNAGGQNLEFVTTEVKINEDLKDSTFY
jgi:hypothetical protein